MRESTTSAFIYRLWFYLYAALGHLVDFADVSHHPSRVLVLFIFPPQLCGFVATVHGLEVDHEGGASNSTP